MSIVRIFSIDVPTAWFLSSLVSVTSLVLHSLTKPYEDSTIDLCELMSLVSMLCLQQTTMLHYALNGNSTDGMESSPKMLEFSTWVGVSTIVVNILVNLWAQFKVWQEIAHSTDSVPEEESDYKVVMKLAHLQAAHDEVARIGAQLQKARAAKRAHAAKLEAMQAFGLNLESKENGGQDSETVATQNPIFADNGDGGPTNDDS
jgi:hypothetical protein